MIIMKYKNSPKTFKWENPMIFNLIKIILIVKLIKILKKITLINKILMIKLNRVKMISKII